MATAARLRPLPDAPREPTMIGRLDELEPDLIARRGRAQREGWLGEIEGLDLTLSHLRGKRDQTRRLARATGLAELDAPNHQGRRDERCQ